MRKCGIIKGDRSHEDRASRAQGRHRSQIEGDPEGNGKEPSKGGTTAFRRQREGRWKHVKYPGWIKWDETLGGLLVAEVHPRKGESDWQLLQAFVGYLDRHLGQYVESISIHYR